MSKAIVVMGESGSGKSLSMQKLPPSETYYIDADGNGLPWKGWADQYNEESKNYIITDDQNKVLQIMNGINEKRPNIHYIVIDTISSIMVADERRRINEKTYDKWTDLAWSVYDICTRASRLRKDLTVIVIAHTQTEVDEYTGEKFTRMLTNGKKLNKIGLEKYFNTVLLCKATDDGKHIFETTSRHSTCKTPYGAFNSAEIPNDIMAVIDALKDY